MASVGLEADDAIVDGTKVFFAVARCDVFGRRVSMCCVHPPVGRVMEVVDDGVGVSNAEIGIKFGPLVGYVVSVGILKKPNVGSGGGDDPVLMKNETVH